MVLQQQLQLSFARALFLLVFLLSLCESVLAKGGGGRGGSSSGGGSRGSSSSGGGYYAASGYHGTRNRGDGGGGCDSTCQKVLLSVFLSIFGICLCCCAGYAFTIYKKKGDFVTACDEADKDVMESAKVPSSGGSAVIDFSSATYHANYTDTTHDKGQAVMSSFGELNFRDLNPVLDYNDCNDNVLNIVANLRSIGGSGSDQDGSFNIMRGKVSIWTGKAYWIETASSGSGNRSLVTGYFKKDHYTNKCIFEGEFQCNNQAKGKFTSFEVQPKDEEQSVRLTPIYSASMPPYSPTQAAYDDGAIECAPNTDYSSTATSTTEDSSSGVPSIFRASGPALKTTTVEPYYPTANAYPVPSYSYHPAASAPPYLPDSPPLPSPSSNDNIPSIFKP